MDRAKELGLEQYFSINDQGKLVEQNEDIRQGIMLDDLLRFHQREEDEYQFLKGFEAQISHALALTAEAVHAIHQQSGSGIGEVLANDIVLKVEEGQIVGARITLPDVAYRNEVEPLEQQATDLADLCFSLGSAGFQVGGEELARAHIQTVLENYDNDFVKTALKALVETRPHYGFITNRPRLGFDRVKNPKQTFEQVRAIVLETLNEKPSLPS